MNKLENTPKNFRKFAALYLYQEVLIYPFNSMQRGYSFMLSTINNIDPSYCALELTPLSQISDEDLDILVKILKYKEDDYFVNNFGLSASEYLKDHIQESKYGFLGFCSTESYLVLEAIDYLRSKGYTLSWMGLSVDDLVSYGWVRLKGIDDEE